MKKINTIIFIVAIIIALVGSLFLSNLYLKKANQIQVVVTTKAILPGEIITANAVSTIPIPSNLAQYIMPGYFSSPGEVIGKMSNTYLAEGQYVPKTAISSDKDPAIILNSLAKKGEKILTISGNQFNLDLKALTPNCKVAIFAPSNKQSPIAFARIIDFRGSNISGWSYQAASGEYKGDFIIIAIDEENFQKIREFLPNIYVAVVKE